MATENIREREREAAIRKAKKGKIRRKRKQLVAIFSIVFTICLATLVTLSLTVWFNVETINVKGSKLYSAEQIISTADVEKGDNLFLISTSVISERLQKQLPFITSVEIKRRLPDSIEISVKETTEKICVISEEKCFSADASGKILAEYDEVPEGLIKILVADDTKMQPGEKISFNTQREAELLELYMKCIEENDWNVNSINLSDPYDTYFKLEDRLIVKFGSSSYFDEKIAYLKGGISNIPNNTEGVFDLSGWTPKNNRPVLSQEDISSFEF
jgi:cell division protein FtsQ